MSIRKISNISRFVKSKYAIDDVKQYMFHDETVFRWGSQKVFFYACGQDKPLLWMDIPKNASSTFKSSMTANGHDITGKHVNKNAVAFADTILAFVRDPRKRWLSGLVEYINLRSFHFEHFDTKSRQAIVESVVDIHNCDEHSGEQISYFTDLPVHKFKIWLIDEPNFTMEAVFKWISENCSHMDLSRAPIVHENRSKDIHKKMLIAGEINDYLTRKNPRGEPRDTYMKHRFDADYAMIEYFKEQDLVVNK